MSLQSLRDEIDRRVNERLLETVLDKMVRKHRAHKSECTCDYCSKQRTAIITGGYHNYWKREATKARFAALKAEII